MENGKIKYLCLISQDECLSTLFIITLFDYRLHALGAL